MSKSEFNAYSAHEYWDRCQEYQKRIHQLEERIVKQRVELARLNHAHRRQIRQWLNRVNEVNDLSRQVEPLRELLHLSRSYVECGCEDERGCLQCILHARINEHFGSCPSATPIYTTSGESV